jgi:hypothetical protein
LFLRHNFSEHCKFQIGHFSKDLKWWKLHSCQDPEKFSSISSVIQHPSSLALSNKSFMHWNCAKRVLRYLKGTCDEKLIFRKTNKDLIGLIDANWTGDSNDRRSCSGFVFILTGGAIPWGSLKQKCVALSSTESEYIALSEGARESV